MQVTVTKAVPERIDECIRIFEDSALYSHYFTDGDRLPALLREGIDKGELFMAVDSKGEAVGAMWIDLKGFFGFFPYLALLGVRKDRRGMGVGHTLLEVFEGVAKDLGYDKVSLLVGEFNPRAKALYQSMGYKKVGFLENAVRQGVNENIMVKTL